MSTLAALAQKELQAGHAKDAADLLRAAEHFSFAALGASAAKASGLLEKLEEAVQDEFDHLTEKAQDHWEHEDKRIVMSKSSLFTAKPKGSKIRLQAGFLPTGP